MSALTKEEIRLLLSLLRQEVIVEATPKFPFRVVTDPARSMGYSEDVKVGRLQAKLSVMLEAARD